MLADRWTDKHASVWTHSSQDDTHTPINGPFLGLPVWAGIRKVKPTWILLKQETVSGSGISWAVCKSALRSRQVTTPAPHHSFFYRPDVLPAAQPTASKHWRDHKMIAGWYRFTLKMAAIIVQYFCCAWILCVSVWQNVQLNADEKRGFILFQNADHARQFAAQFNRFVQETFWHRCVVMNSWISAANVSPGS